MEHYKISKLLNNWTVSKCVKRKWVEVNGLSDGHYSVNKNLMLASDLCYYSDAYIFVKRKVNVLAVAGHEHSKAQKILHIKYVIYQELTTNWWTMEKILI